MVMKPVTLYTALDILVEPDDRRSRREQERIVRFLERVLEAERVGAASGN